MWVEVRHVPNRMLAEMWKDLFEGEGIPSRYLPADGTLKFGEASAYKVYVPGDKAHIVEEILRKI
ncbi:MAG: hypothetical protein FJZ95_03025 [Chloroflexi bacterium]|nr:hypothetical protein [Chloroflexota bacterium]